MSHSSESPENLSTHIGLPLQDATFPSLPDLGEKVAQETGLGLQEATKAAEIVQQQMLEASYSGPVPLPFHVRELNAIRPELGTRVVEDYLTQRAHDRHLDTTHAKLSETLLTKTHEEHIVYLRYAGRGQILGFLCVLIFVGAALGSAYAGHPGLSLAFLAPAAVGVIRQFIIGFEKPEIKE